MKRFGTFVQIDEYSFLDLYAVIGFELITIEEQNKYRWLFVTDSENMKNAKSYHFNSIDEAMGWINKIFKEKKNGFINSN